MSLELLDPFWLQAIPDSINETIDNDYPIPLPSSHPLGPHLISSSTATTTTDVGTPALAFNATGSYLAAGRQDGAVLIWDFESKSVGGPTRCLLGHVREVTSISWSANGRRILTTGSDNLAILWDLKGKNPGGQRLTSARCETAVMDGDLSPRDDSLFVITLQHARPRLYKVSADGRSNHHELAIEIEEEDGMVEDGVQEYAKIKRQITVIQFSISGDMIYGGTSRGELIAWDTYTHNLLWIEKLAGSSAIRHLRLDNLGKGMITNSSDRIIRHFQFVNPEDSTDDEALNKDGRLPPTVVNKFQDLVNRISWSDVGYSPNGDFIYGGSDQKGAHSFYFWDTTPLTGGLVRIIEGMREPLEAMAWHPTRPIMATVGTSGLIAVYQAQKEEEWSAFAPEFVELEDNVEYREREDEFDIVNMETLRQKQQDDEESVIDIGLFRGPVNGAAANGDVTHLQSGSYCIPVSPERETEEEAFLDALTANGQDMGDEGDILAASIKLADS